jgi:uncharacterized SAM-binding protein YcdF (DUF218 family)
MPYDVILALGRGISKDGELPRVSVENVKVAKSLLEQRVAPRIVFSGRWSRHYAYTPVKTEAQAMKELAVELGVDPKDVVTETKSLDTVSNFYYLKKGVLEPNSWKKILLLTLHKEDERALLTGQYILGPEYEIEPYSIDYTFSLKKADYILETERKKVAILRDFISRNNIRPGDHEKFLKQHQAYIDEHDIPPTFKEA